MMKHACVLLMACLFPALVSADELSWRGHGRINDIAFITYPDNNTSVEVTINAYVAPDANFRQITFQCGGYLSCAVAMLGSCTKASLTTVYGGTTRVVWQCVNKHYADCWIFTGYMIPQLVGTEAESDAGCLF